MTKHKSHYEYLTGAPLSFPQDSHAIISLAPYGEASIITPSMSGFMQGDRLPQQSDGEGFYMGKTGYYISVAGLILTIIASVCYATWTISSHISNSNNEVRKELQASIESSKQELTTGMASMENRVNDRFTRIDVQFDKTESRIDKAESKIDEHFKETNKNINELKDLIGKSK